MPRSRAAASHRAVPAGSALALRRRFHDEHRGAAWREADPACAGGGRTGGVFRSGGRDGGKIIFSKYVHEHLLQHARDVGRRYDTSPRPSPRSRRRGRICPQCGTLAGNRVVAMKRLNGWLQGGAHAPRVPLSAPSRKTSGEPEDSSSTGECRTRGASGTPRGRVCSPSILCVSCEHRVRDSQEE